jgi:hypothetical protein
MNATLIAPPVFSSPSANDQLKARFGSWFWGSMVAATVIHFLILFLWPTFHITDVSTGRGEIPIMQLPTIRVSPPTT